MNDERRIAGRTPRRPARRFASLARGPIPEPVSRALEHAVEWLRRRAEGRALRPRIV
jgi:hypothetical protein